jgi:hypothetical protein
MKTSGRLLISLTVVVLALTGCATPHTVVSQTYNFDNLKRIGITKFDTSGKITGIEDLFVQQLMKKGYTTVERDQIDHVIAEQQMSTSALFDPATSKKLGQLLGIDGLLTGEVTYYSPKKSKTRMEESDSYFSTPVYKKVSKKNADGTYSVVLKQIATNTRVERHRFPVTVTTYPQIGIVAKIIDTETAEVVWVGSILEEGENIMDAEENCVHLLVKSMWKDIKELKQKKAGSQL